MHSLTAQAMLQCKGITRAGKRCAVTSRSNWTIDNGTLVAGPLLKGGDYCLLHAKPFLTKASEVEDFEQMVIFVVDLETTGTDITKESDFLLQGLSSVKGGLTKVSPF